MLQFKFVNQVVLVINMKIAEDWNNIGNCNYCSNFLKVFHLANQYSRHMKEKQRIQNCICYIFHLKPESYSHGLLYIQNDHGDVQS